MAKKKSSYANIVMPIKKVLDKVEEVVHNVSIVEDDTISQEVKEAMASIKEDTIVEFNPTLNAYVPYLNPKSKKWELITTSIDPITNRVEVFRRELICDNEHSAFMEMQKQYATDVATKIKEKRKQERNRG
jgi:hypothetical protein